MSGSPDLVVVGAGVVGMAAALAARDRGASVVVLDDGPPGGAGSAGPGRIFRHIHARPELVSLAIRSRLAWDVLSERLGRPLVDGRGTLLVGDGVNDAAARLADAGVPHQRLAPGGLPAPLAPVGPGLLDPGGGTIDAAAAVAGLADALGPAIRRVAVRGIRAEGDAASALTDGGPVTAARLLACPGARAGALAADLGVALPIGVRRHLRVAFRVPGGEGPALPPGALRRARAGRDRLRHGAAGRRRRAGHARRRRPAGVRGGRRDPRVGAAALPGLGARPAGLLACDSVQLGDDPDAFVLAGDGPAAAVRGRQPVQARARSWAPCWPRRCSRGTATRCWRPVRDRRRPGHGDLAPPGQVAARRAARRRPR